MALSKDRITESIYHQCGFSKKKSGVMLESLLEIVKKTLESGKDVVHM
jgi:integration host factor subunit alpha